MTKTNTIQSKYIQLSLKHACFTSHEVNLTGGEVYGLSLIGMKVTIEKYGSLKIEWKGIDWKMN